MTANTQAPPHRRRGRWAWLAAAVAMALVAGFVLFRGSQDSPSPGDEPDGSAYAGFRCDGPGALDQPPPLVDASTQQATVEAVSGLEGDGFAVGHAQATPIGVIALVRLEGATLAQVRAELGGLGVVDLAPIESTNPDDGDPQAPEEQVDLMLSDRVQQAAARVDRVVRGRRGFVSLWHWGDAASIPVFWHGRVPRDVRTLAEHPLGNGVQVTIHQVPYDRKELARAANRVTRLLSRGGAEETAWSVVGRCADNTGLSVGVTSQDARVQSDLSRRLGARVGMGVMVTYAPKASVD